MIVLNEFELNRVDVSTGQVIENLSFFGRGSVRTPRANFIQAGGSGRFWAGGQATGPGAFLSMGPDLRIIVVDYSDGLVWGTAELVWAIQDGGTKWSLLP